MWSDLVVVSTPPIKLFPSVGQAHEPTRVQALRPQSAIERVGATMDHLANSSTISLAYVTTYARTNRRASTTASAGCQID